MPWWPIIISSINCLPWNFSTDPSWTLLQKELLSLQPTSPNTQSSTQSASSLPKIKMKLSSPGWKLACSNPSITPPPTSNKTPNSLCFDTLIVLKHQPQSPSTLIYQHYFKPIFSHFTLLHFLNHHHKSLINTSSYFVSYLFLAKSIYSLNSFIKYRKFIQSYKQVF